MGLRSMNTMRLSTTTTTTKTILMTTLRNQAAGKGEQWIVKKSDNGRNKEISQKDERKKVERGLLRKLAGNKRRTKRKKPKLKRRQKGKLKRQQERLRERKRRRLKRQQERQR